MERYANPILVTGGAGFIGSNFVLHWISRHKGRVINLDLLTYAGNLGNLAPIEGNPDHIFVRGDISDRPLVDRLMAEHRPSAIVHFAAESHVDRSILGPEAFLRTNIYGTFHLLEAARTYFATLDGERAAFRFLHVSTDEVYGALGPNDAALSRGHALCAQFALCGFKGGQRSPGEGMGTHLSSLPALITNCSNNYGPLQFPEKLLPLMINNALAGKPLPVYGDGHQVRDWLFVRDHCRAIETVLENGKGRRNLQRGRRQSAGEHRSSSTCCAICWMNSFPARRIIRTASLIRFVQDRPGHDRRYAIDATQAGKGTGLARPGDICHRPAQNRGVVPEQQGVDGGSHVGRIPELGASELRPSR